MNTKKLAFVLVALVSIGSSGALAASHYDGGCTQLHFAQDAIDSTSDIAESTPAPELQPMTALNPIVEGAVQPKEGPSERLQQARFKHSETAGAVDCELDAIED